MRDPGGATIVVPEVEPGDDHDVPDTERTLPLLPRIRVVLHVPRERPVRVQRCRRCRGTGEGWWRGHCRWCRGGGYALGWR